MPSRARITPPICTATLIAVLLLQILPANAYATEDQPAEHGAVRGARITFDLMLLRPLRLGALLAGGALYLPAMLMTAPGGKQTIHEAEDFFLNTPARELFERPLGDF